MDRYHITLFLHIFTLVVVAAVTAITKLADDRRASARTVGEALDWHKVLMSTARLFPVCLVAFLLTGGYMLAVVKINSWSSGFVVAGLVGVAWLFASGTFLGIKGGALTKLLEGMAAKGADQPAPKLAPPRLVAALPLINAGLALGVAFDMVTRTPSIPIALGIMVLGMAIGAAFGLRTPSPQ